MTMIYGLWERKPGGGFTRLLPSMAFPRPRAVVVFQSALLNGAMIGGRIPERRLIAVGRQVDLSHRRNWN